MTDHNETNRRNHCYRRPRRHGIVSAAYPRPPAAAQSAPLRVHAVDIDVVPGQIDSYLAALKENGAASVKESSCREFDITVSQKDPNHVFIFEVYDSADAAQAHRETEHFKKYAATTKDMVAKRELKSLTSVAMNVKGM